MSVLFTSSGLVALITLTFRDCAWCRQRHLYFNSVEQASGFSVFAELINLRVRRVAAPVHLHEPYG
jgi:hypothetical protein